MVHRIGIGLLAIVALTGCTLFLTRIAPMGVVLTPYTVSIEPEPGRPTPAPISVTFQMSRGLRTRHLTTVSIAYIENGTTSAQIAELQSPPLTLSPPLDIPAYGLAVPASFAVQVVTEPVLTYFRAHSELRYLGAQVSFSGTSDEPGHFSTTHSMTIERAPSPSPEATLKDNLSRP